MMTTNVVAKGVVWLAPVATLLGADGRPNINDEFTVWAVRGVLTLGVAAIAYLLRDVALTVRETHKLVVKHDATLLLHGLMFEQWVDRLGEEDTLNTPGRRDMDKVLGLLIEERKARKEGKK